MPTRSARRNGPESPSFTPARNRVKHWPPVRRAVRRWTRLWRSSTPAAKTPSSRWKVRFGFLLGLERVLSMKPPTTAAGTELRKHQIDALAGMLTELIAANQRHAEDENGNGNGDAELEPEEGEEEDELGRRRGRRRARGRLRRRGSRRRPPLPLPPPDGVGEDDRRRRLRRSSAHARDPDPHAPPTARLAVPARPDDRGLRRPLHRLRSSGARNRSAAIRSRSRRTPGSPGTPTRSRARRISS